MRTKYLAIAFAIAVFLCAFVPVTNGVLADSVSIEIDKENFPDDHLRETVRKFDDNGDMILSSDEIDKVYDLTVYKAEVFTGIEHFTNLSTLEFRECIMTMYIRSFPELKNLRQLWISDCSNLEKYYNTRTDLTEIRISGCKNLSVFSELYSNNYSEIYIDNSPKLTELSLMNDTNVNNLTLDTTNVKNLDLSRLGIHYLSLKSCPNMEPFDFVGTEEHTGVYLYNVPVNSVDLSRCTKLEDFEIKASFDNIDLSHCLKLHYLYIDAPVQSLDLSPFKKLKTLYVKGPIKSLDLSNCTKLEKLRINGPVEDLDLSNNRYINELRISSSVLKSIDISNNGALSAYFNNAVPQASQYKSFSNDEDCLDYVCNNSSLAQFYSYNLTLNKNIKVITCESNQIDLNSKELPNESLLKLASNYDYDKNGLLDETEIINIDRINVKEVTLDEEFMSVLRRFDYARRIELSGVSVVNTEITTPKSCEEFKLFDSVKVKNLVFSDECNFKCVFLDGNIESVSLGYQPQLTELYVITENIPVVPSVNISGCPILMKLYKEKAEMGWEVDVNTNERIEAVWCDRDLNQYLWFTPINYPIVTNTINAFAENGNVTGTGDYDFGKEVTLTATPDQGYSFAGWLENNNIVSADSTYVFTARSCRDLVAKFEKITPTPTTAPKPTNTDAPAKPTVVPSTAPVTESSNYDTKIAEFVKRIYVYVLDREPEEEGAKFWSDELYNFRRTGAQVAMDFLFAPEFENRNTDDNQFVTILYKTFFGRDPEAEGFDYWVNELKTGSKDRVAVAQGFVYSQEWANTCAEYGILSGGDIKPTGKIEPSALTYAFVERLYNTALGRSFDEEGRQYWASELSNYNITGEYAGASFFLSDEMTGYGLSDSEFLNRLYKTFMDRDPDDDGQAFWLDYMKSNDRSSVVFGFTRSPEFTEKCVKARILPYS